MLKRILVPFWLVGLALWAIVSPRDRSISLILFAVFGGILLLTQLARKNPEAPWVYWLWAWEIGPRTNVATMSRRDLYRSGVRFLFFAVVLLGLLITTGHFGLQNGEQPVAALLTVFVCSVSILLCSVGGVYLLIRGVLKKGL